MERKKKEKHVYIAVAPAFRRKLKAEAANCDQKMLPFTAKLARDTETLTERWNRKKEKRKGFKIGL